MKQVFPKHLLTWLALTVYYILIMHSSNKGFTLVEILIALAVAVILGLIILKFFNIQNRSLHVETMISQISHTGQATMDIVDHDLQTARRLLLAEENKLQFSGDVTGNGSENCVHYELVGDIIIRAVAGEACGTFYFRYPDEFYPYEVEKVTKYTETLKFVYYDTSGNEIDYTDVNILDTTHSLGIALVIRSDQPRDFDPDTDSGFVIDNPLTFEIETDSYVRRLFKTRIYPRMLNARTVSE